VEKTKLFFFSFQEYYGSVDTQKFTFQSGGFKFLVPTMDGDIIAENPITIKLRLVVPLLTVCLYSIFPISMLVPVWSVEEMTINGVTRVAALSETMGFSLFAIGLPGIIFYANVIWPLKRIESRLIEVLGLERKHEARH
jgi:hypothetical protein